MRQKVHQEGRFDEEEQIDFEIGNADYRRCALIYLIK